MVNAEKSIYSSAPSKVIPRLRLHYLDGIRGLAALFVVFHHTWQGPFGRNAHTGLFGFLTNWALYGHLAVDVFIVLSGFCLILPVAHTSFINKGAINFYLRRAHRILPPFCFALLLSLPINFLIHKVGNHPLVSIRAILINLFLLQDWFPQYNILDGPLWSVAVEWKIYFLFPLFVWIWRRFGRIWMLLSAFMIGYGATLIFHVLQPTVEMGNTCPWYVLLFAIGIAAGIAAIKEIQFVPHLRLRWVLLTSLLLLGYLLFKFPITAQGEENLYVSHLPLIDPIAGLVTAAMLLLLYRTRNNEHSGFLRLTSWNPLVFVGTFAYSLYLIHLPILWIIVGGVHKIAVIKSSMTLTVLIMFLVAIPFTVCLAYLFFVLCERPFLNKRNGTKCSTDPPAEKVPIPT